MSETSNGAVFVDTSIWIEFFNNADSSHAKRVEQLIKHDRAAITGIVVAELIQGASNDRESSTLKRTLESLTYLPINKQIWTQAGQLAKRLRSRGETLPLSDCVIASVSISEDIPVYTLDSDVDRFDGLEVIHSPK